MGLLLLLKEANFININIIFEPSRRKTNNVVLRTVPTQTELKKLAIEA